MNFNEFGFDSRIIAGVNACGYQTPTPIQQETIPSAMRGLDIMGLAQTGTGKTAAFALPVMHRLLTGPRGTLRALVVAPTRELAEQICEGFRSLGRNTKLQVTTIYGGVGMKPQVQTLRRGVDIVVACPGRLLDHVRQGTINLRNISIAVLDEADMMLDMGFLPDVRAIMAKLPAKRQNMMFSATMPEDICALSSDMLDAPHVAKIRHSKPIETVAHALYPVTQQLKTPLLLALLLSTDSESVLIFTRTKHRAKKLGTLLVQNGHRAASLQGNLSQSARQAALEGFRRGQYSVLVATDIAARGIDVSQVSHVINYDFPTTVDAYTHRIGRTGRASRPGDAFSLVTREDEIVIRQIERVLGSNIQRCSIDGFDYKQAAPPSVGRDAPPRHRVSAPRHRVSAPGHRDPATARTRGRRDARR
ncbi:MAG: DEAD/DEAH box helicase [bacterium]|nr:DEAD/DEAH box helicase [Candidatus Sumerlaeota bacterium]